MSKIRLSAPVVSRATCPAGKGKVDLWDTGCRGLLLEVRASGGKTYYFRYRDKRGRVRQLKLADVRDITLIQARTLADIKRADIAMGKDPSEEKRMLRQVLTVAQFLNDRYLPYVKTYKRAWLADASYVRNHLVPTLGHKYLDELTREDVLSFQDKMRQKGYALGTCNRCVVLLRYAMNLAIKWSETGVGHNPTKDVPLYTLNNMRERYLSNQEVEVLVESVRQSINPMLRYIIPMLILTGTRKREVLDAKWEDINIPSMSWRIPVTKSGKPRFVPISEAVVRLLQEIPKIKGCPYIFANPKTGKPYVSIFTAWDTARRKVGMEDVRIHDLRHSFASFLVNAGRSLYEVQRLLGHTQIKTTQRYSHLSHETLLEATNILSTVLRPAMNGAAH